MSILKPCKGSDAFEFIPEKEKRLNLKKVVKRFKDVRISTDIVIVVKYRGVDVSIYPSGRMLIHTQDARKAGDIASALRRIIDV